MRKNFKSNKGFTLVEILGVIIVLAFLAFLISEVIINNVNDANKKLEKLAEDIIISSAREYVSKNPNEFPKVIETYYYIEYEQLKSKKLIIDEMLPDIDYVDTLKDMYVRVEFDGKGYTYILVNDKIDFTTLLIQINPNGGKYKGSTEIYRENIGAGKTIVLEPPISLSEEICFTHWSIDVEDAEIIENTLTIGKTNATITANWDSCSTIPVYTYLKTNSNGEQVEANHELIDYGDGNWKIRFLESGVLTINKIRVLDTIDIFLVGGGGAGGGNNSSNCGSGGGAGGKTLTQKGYKLSATSYTITVGAGGQSSRASGTASSAFGYSAAGGGGGGVGCYASTSVGAAGGSGGSGGGRGGSNWSDSYGLWGYDAVAGGSYGKGPGGTNSGGGQESTTCEFGEGTTSGCNSGVTAYAGGGGGGGGSYENGGTMPGGAGGGGRGGSSPQAGVANTGGGGGGGGKYTSEAGGKGGSGIVIIRNAR